MTNGFFKVPTAANEPILSYLPGSAERASLKKELEKQSDKVEDVPLIIGGKDIRSGDRGQCVMPHKHDHVLANFYMADSKALIDAISAAQVAKIKWAKMPFEHRASIFLKAADLLSGPWRDRINASTMLGQSKTVYQAEIDSACELADFLRFNVAYADKIYRQQPENSKGIWNRLSYRPLDGFVLAISPFNFTSIGGNLSIAPAIMGNTVLWKPASTAVLSNYYIMRLLEEAGLPAGVINFVPARGCDISEYVLTHPDLAGFHFTGSTATFNSIWRRIGEHIDTYRTYPRLVGETGGKDFVFAHPSANIDVLSAALIRGAFEYQGQKCSAASRAYIPESLWETLKPRLLKQAGALKTGDPVAYDTFMGAVIDKRAFDNITSYIDQAKTSNQATVLCGDYDDSQGYFITPTIIQAFDPHYTSMVEEIFGPVLTVYVYPDNEWEKTLEICDSSSDYGLTGAIFATDRNVICQMEEALTHTAGNFYINDKPTGAVVGQQPFGGSRASGTNDKAGSILNLYRWVSPRTIKENFLPSTDILYPYMIEKD